MAYLIGELFRNTLSDESPMEPQLIAMRQKSHVLKSLGLTLEDALVAIAMVISLPESYSTIRTILMSSEDKLSPDTVVAQVLIEEKSRKNSTAQTALVAQTGRKGKGPAKDGKDGNKLKKCSYCKKKGHIKDECRKLKAHLESKPSDSKSAEKKEGDLTAKVASVDDKMDQPETVRLFIAEALAKRKTLLSHWIVDSGASSPMSSQRDWFHTYRDLIPPKKVWLGDERYILATGVGQLHLDMMLENGQMCLTIIRNAYYVPELSGNLISVSYLTKRGYQVNFGNDGCRILDSAGTLCGKANEIESLYILKATPVIPERAYISHSLGEISEDTDLDPDILQSAYVARHSKANLNTWHRRLGHIASDSVKRLYQKHMVKGMEITDLRNHTYKEICVPCLQGKHSRDAIPKVTHSENHGILYRVSSDLCGPMEIQTPHGEKYFLTFIDGKSHYTKVRLLRLKSDTYSAIKTLVERAEVETGKRVNFFRSDGGGEYDSKEFAAYFESKGIHHEKTNAYTPQENGVAERMNRTIQEMALSFLKDAGLSKTYWGYAVLYAVYIINRTPTRVIKGDLTPFEAYTGNKPSVSHIRIFGCKAFAHIPHEKRQKLDAKTIECTHLGYSEHKRAYLLLHRPTGRILESRDVHFDEGDGVEAERVVIEADYNENEHQTSDEASESENDSTSDEAEVQDLLDDGSDDGDDGDGPPDAGKEEPRPNLDDERSNSSAGALNGHSGSAIDPSIKRSSPTDSSTSKTPGDSRISPHTSKTAPNHPNQPNPPELRRSSRIRRAPIRDDDQRYSVTSYGHRNHPGAAARIGEDGGATGRGGDEEAPDSDRSVTPVTDETAKATKVGDPLSYDDAMSRPDATEWRKACQTELDMFKKQGLYEEVPRPRDRKIVGCKWVFLTKTGADGQIERYKARVVAQGFSQVEGIDYNETFAPVTKFNSIRVLLALAARLDLEVHQMDVKSAFLNGELEEEIYMRVPPGHNSPPGVVWKLNKALYGLKQASREWYKKLSTEIKSIGFRRSSVDHCVFYKNQDNDLLIIAVYVDDMMILSNKLNLVNETKRDLASRFEMTDLGEIHWILNMEVTRDRKNRIIRLSQSQYIESILERHGMADCRPVSTPMEANLKLEKLVAAEVDVHDYQSTTGSAMYGMIGTRPDLAHSVGALSRHTATPGQQHQTALKRVYRYLRGTSEYGITYDGKLSDPDPQVYCDADWANDPNDRKSISGYVVTMCGGAVSWSSKKQSVTALSSTEAEYIAAARAAQEASWLQSFLTEIGCPPTKPIPFHVDNQSAIKLIKNPVTHDRTKHIDVKYHYVRDAQDNNVIDVKYCPTGNQTADILTKALSREKHKRFAECMGLSPT